MIKSKRMRWALVRIREMRNAYIILVVKYQGKGQRGMGS
jgi:hypothetical protein